MAPRDPVGTAEALRQTNDTTRRHQAIAKFGKGLRNGKRFQSFWDAIGGAQELAHLMADFSLRDVKAMCIHLGQTASAPNARPARRAALGELVQLLFENRSADGTLLDSRPLHQYYQDIVPACNLDVVEQWETQHRVQWTDRQSKFLLRGHSERYEQQFLQDVFSAAGAERNMTFAQAKRLLQGKVGLTRTILTRLIKQKAEIRRIPGDLMYVVVLPALKRLSKRQQYGGEAQDELLELVTRCFQTHPDLASHNHLGRGNPVYYATLRWMHVREDPAASATNVQQTTTTLTQLLALMPTPQRDRPYSLDVIMQGVLLAKKQQNGSYELLRLTLQHIAGYKLDISDDSPEGLARLRNVSTQANLWPPKMFFSLGDQDGLALFERLSSADVTGNFLLPRYGGLMNQGQDEDPTHGDVAILRCLLLNKAQKEPARSEWANRARAMVQERKKRSQESRESQGRLFWAKSALNLSIAIGDMEVVDDTIIWARRYNNEPLVLKEFYSAYPFACDELAELLSAVPRKLEDDNDRYTDGDVAAAKKNIELSGRIIVHLAETMKMTFSQSQITYSTWSSVVSLLKSMARRRINNAARFHALFDLTVQNPKYAESPTVEALWKPYIGTLVTIEALMDSAPYRHQFDMGPAFIFPSIGSSGTTKSDLLAFLMESMKLQFSSESMKTRMHAIVKFVSDITRSNQPWLAFPFIREIIIDGDGADSTWYRQLLTFPFLASLPAKMTSDCLHMLAETMQAQMRKQASRPTEVIGEDGKAIPSAPAIKVTTVKMMAEILRDTALISQPAACDILLGLLAEARHIDIRVAIVNSLLSILKQPSTLPEIHARILDAFETSVGPVLAQLSERRPVTEEQWAAAERGDAPIPDIGGETPLYSLLSELDLESKKLMPEEARSRIIEMLMRALAESAANNARWNKLFLARHGFTLDKGEVPACPVSPPDLAKLFRKFTTHAPASTLAMLRELALVNLDPNPGVIRVTEAIKADRDLIKSNAGKHWLAQFQNPLFSALRYFGVVDAARLLQQSPEKLVSKRADGQGITVPMLQEFILAVADRLLAIQPHDLLDSLVAQLCCARNHSLEEWHGWRENVVPVLETIVAKIEDLRTRHLNDPHAAPKALPKTFQIRSWLLPIPFSAPSDAPLEWEAFVSELTKLLGWLTEHRGMPYHEEFAQLKADVLLRVKQQNYTSVALQLGRHRSSSTAGTELSLADYLRLELAAALLLGASGAKIDSFGTEVQSLVDSWVQSHDQVVCAMGLLVQTKIGETARKV